MRFIAELYAKKLLLLTAEAREERDNFFPCFEVVAAPANASAEEVGVVGGVDEIVAIEELLLIDENHAIESRRAQEFLNPALRFGDLLAIVGGSRCHNAHVVALNEELVGFVHACSGFAKGVVEGAEVNKHGGAFHGILLVVNPADNRYQVVEHSLVVEVVLAMKMDCLWVVAAKQGECVDYGVVVAKQTIDVLLLGGRKTGEIFVEYFFVFFYKPFGDHEVLHAVESWVVECDFAGVLGYGGVHLKCRIDDDAVETMQHLGEHAAHGSAYDEVGLLALAGGEQQVESLGRVYG